MEKKLKKSRFEMRMTQETANRLEDLANIEGSDKTKVVERLINIEWLKTRKQIVGA